MSQLVSFKLYKDILGKKINIKQIIKLLLMKILILQTCMCLIIFLQRSWALLFGTKLNMFAEAGL